MNDLKKYIEIFQTLKYGFRNKLFDEFENNISNSFLRRKDEYLVDFRLLKDRFYKLPSLHDIWDRQHFEVLRNELVNFTKQILKDQNNKVFIVHGRDIIMRNKMNDLLHDVNIKPIILENETNEGKTIIEKFLEKSDDCHYAVVLMSPDDIGALSCEQNEIKKRARQNVILELGYFIGKIGKQNILLLYSDGIEMPTDMLGFVHILYDNEGDWKYKVIKELKKQRFIIE